MKKRKDYRKLSDEEKKVIDEKIKRDLPIDKYANDFIISNIKDGYRCYECYTITCICEC